MKKQYIAILALLCIGSVAHGNLIPAVSNLGQASSGGLLAYPDPLFGVPFTTGTGSPGGSGWDEFTLTIQLNSANIIGFGQVQLRSTDGSGAPNGFSGLLKSYAFVDGPNNTLIIENNSANSGITLAENTTYFFDFAFNSASLDLAATTSPAEDSGGLTGWSIGDNTWSSGSGGGTGSWTESTTGVIPQFSIEVIPEPAVASLLLLVGIGMISARRLFRD